MALSGAAGPGVIVLGVDWGRARMGLAVSDEAGLLAHPLGTVEERSLAGAVSAVARAARERGAGEVVVGLPKNMDGSEGESARQARAFAAELGRATGLPVRMRGERLSSWEAADRLKGAPRARRKNRDDAAACLILQGHLDEARRGRP